MGNGLAVQDTPLADSPRQFRGILKTRFSRVPASLGRAAGEAWLRAIHVEQRQGRGAQAAPESADFLAGLVCLGLSEEGLAPFRAEWVQSHGKRRATIGAVFLYTEAQILQSDEAEILAA